MAPSHHAQLAVRELRLERHGETFSRAARHPYACTIIQIVSANIRDARPFHSPCRRRRGVNSRVSGMERTRNATRAQNYPVIRLDGEQPPNGDLELD